MCNKPDLIDRLTLAGWVLLVILCGIFTVLVPVLLMKVYPAALQAGGRTTKYAIIATFMGLGVPTFLLCKWLLEKLGISIARPPHSETQHLLCGQQPSGSASRPGAEDERFQQR